MEWPFGKNKKEDSGNDANERLEYIEGTDLAIVRNSNKELGISYVELRKNIPTNRSVRIMRLHTASDGSRKLSVEVTAKHPDYASKFIYYNEAGNRTEEQLIKPNLSSIDLSTQVKNNLRREDELPRQIDFNKTVTEFQKQLASGNFGSPPQLVSREM